MVGEIRTYLADLETLVEKLPNEAPQPVDADLLRAVHTLAGTLSMAPLGQAWTHSPQRVQASNSII